MCLHNFAFAICLAALDFTNEQRVHNLSRAPVARKDYIWRTAPEGRRGGDVKSVIAAPRHHCPAHSPDSPHRRLYAVAVTAAAVNSSGNQVPANVRKFTRSTDELNLSAAGIILRSGQITASALRRAYMGLVCLENAALPDINTSQ